MNASQLPGVDIKTLLTEGLVISIHGNSEIEKKRLLEGIQQYLNRNGYFIDINDLPNFELLVRPGATTIATAPKCSSNPRTCADPQCPLHGSVPPTPSR